MAEEYGPDLVTLVDDEGNQYEFEVIDAIETDDGRYIAILPYHENPEESLDEDGELVILKVVDENGEEVLETIEEDDEFDEIAELFEERLKELYEIDLVE
ncbi:MAG: DUF1292 domain-containing protein [Oscillospiraceae bacterium]|nr:DUF1292 domain-containing protein [Oscillospiraceae bacterium]